MKANKTISGPQQLILAVWYFAAVLLLTTLMMNMSGAAESSHAITRDYPMHKLTANVYVIQGPTEQPSPGNQAFRNNPGIVLTSEGVVVIDPGSTAYVGEMVVRRVKAITDKPIVAVFNSHAHGDHWLGNEGIKLAYPRAVIYADSAMKEMNAHDEGEMWLKAFNDLSHGAAEGTHAVGVDVAVRDGEIIKIGDTEFHILRPGAAHSNSDIMVYVPAEKVLFFGDIVRDGLLGPFLSSFKGNIEAIDRGLACGATIFVPGHGRSGDTTVAKNYRQFLHTVREQVRAGFREGASDFDVKPKVEQSTRAFSKWTEYKESIGKLVNIAYLEVEKEEF